MTAPSGMDVGWAIVDAAPTRSRSRYRSARADVTGRRATVWVRPARVRRRPGAKWGAELRSVTRPAVARSVACTRVRRTAVDDHESAAAYALG